MEAKPPDRQDHDEKNGEKNSKATASATDPTATLFGQWRLFLTHENQYSIFICLLQANNPVAPLCCVPCPFSQNALKTVRQEKLAVKTVRLSD